MLSFVAAFHETMAANIFAIFNVVDILNAAKEAEIKGKPSSITLSIVVTGVLAVIFLFVMIMYLLAALAIIVVRIIMLWMLIILSPLAFLMAAFPQGVSYTAWSRHA